MATSMEAATASALVAEGGLQSRQFQGLFQIIPFTFTFDEDSIGAEDSSTADIAVVGAALGDFVLIACKIDQVSVNIFGFVQSADTVTVVAQNLETADANTTLAGNPAFNGIVLHPNKNVLAWN